MGQILVGYTTDEKKPPSDTHVLYVHWGTLWHVVCTMFEITFVRILMDECDIGWGVLFKMYLGAVNFVLLIVIRAVIVKQVFKSSD